MAGNNVDWKNPQAVLSWLETQPTLASLRYAASQLGLVLEGKPKKAEILETLRKHVEEQVKVAEPPEPVPVVPAVPPPTPAAPPATFRQLRPRPPTQSKGGPRHVDIPLLEDRVGEVERRVVQLDTALDAMSPEESWRNFLQNLTAAGMTLEQIAGLPQLLKEIQLVAAKLTEEVELAKATTTDMERLIADTGRATAELLNTLAQLQELQKAAAYAPAKEAQVIEPTEPVAVRPAPEVVIEPVDKKEPVEKPTSTSQAQVARAAWETVINWLRAPARSRKER